MTFTDDTPLNGTELAAYMRFSRWTVGRDKRAGYRFEFGFKTTPRHYKKWKREQVAAADTISVEDSERMERQLNRLRSTSGKAHVPS